MTTGKLLGYAVGGIIAGLLIENMMLRVKQRAGHKARIIKKEARKASNAIMHAVH